MGLEQSAEGFPAQDIGKSDVLAEVLVNPALRQQYRQQRLDVFLARVKSPDRILKSWHEPYPA